MVSNIVVGFKSGIRQTDVTQQTTIKQPLLEDLTKVMVLIKNKGNRWQEMLNDAQNRHLFLESVLLSSSGAVFHAFIVSVIL